MLKRVVTIGVMALGLAAMRGDEARAHLAGYQFVGYWRHVSSYACGGFFKQVKNLAQHPALFECNATVNEFQVLCGNPKEKDVRPGTPSGPILLMGEDLFREADITDKVKGRALKEISFPDQGSPLLNDAFCAELNSGGKGRGKWQAIDELVFSVDLRLKTFDCVAGGNDPCADRIQAYEALLHCTLPAQYSLDNPPPSGTDYDCDLLNEIHLN